MAHKQEPTRNFAITRRTCSLVEVEVCRYIKTESGSEVDSKLRYYFIAGEPLRSRGPFLECPDNFMGPKSCVCIQDKSFNNFENDTIKLSDNEAKSPVCELGTVLLFNRISDPRSYQAFRETGPRTLF